MRVCRCGERAICVLMIEGVEVPCCSTHHVISYLGIHGFLDMSTEALARGTALESTRVGVSA